MKLSEIYDKIGQKELMEYYYGETIIDKRPIYRNKLRGDRKGTCSFFWSNKGRYLFNDFARNTIYDVINYVKELYNLNSFIDVMNRIKQDFKLSINSKPARNSKNNELNSTNVNSTSNYVKKKNFEIDVRPYKNIDLLFWNQFNINIDTLHKFNVYPVKTAYIEDSNSSSGKTMIYQYKRNNVVDEELDPNSNTNQLCYVYVVTGGKSKKIKIYQPYNKKFKWLSNTSNVDIFGLEQLEDYINVVQNRIDKCKVKLKGKNRLDDKDNINTYVNDNNSISICNEYDKRLFIVSGLKDLMVMYEMGFNAIAPTSETSMIDNEIIDNLKQYFTLIVLYDLDMTGIKSSIKQMIKYDCHLFILPILENNKLKNNQYKDIAEYSQHLGLLQLYDIIETNTIQYKYN